MELKDIRKLVLLAICTFMIGFGCLIVYYIDYSAKAEQRKNNGYESEILNQQDIINNMQASQNNSDINSSTFGNGTIEYNYQDHDLDKYQEYVDDQLTLNTDKTQEEMDDIYDTIIRDIRLKISSGNLSGASEAAHKAATEHTFIDGKQYANISALKSVNGFLKLSGKHQMSYLSKIYDPAIYVSLFYYMKPEYQAKLLGNENYLYIPASADYQMGIISVETAGPLESKASLHFSDLDTLDIYKVTVELYGVKYKIFVAGKLNYSYRITNIDFVDTSNTTFSTYVDYFNVWGRE